MPSVMPTAAFPKTYRVNGTDYTIKNAAEDTTLQASPVFYTSLVAQTYPKTLQFGTHTIKVNSASEEASARSSRAQG